MSMQEPETDIQALVALPPKMTALEVFSAKIDDASAHPITPILARVRAEIDAFTGDLSTASGRKAIASMAYRVTRAKTTLDGIGKKLNDEAKDVPKRIDATRKHCRDLLDTWAEEVRAPLDAWEAAEAARKAKHTTTLAAIANTVTLWPHPMTSVEITQRIAFVQNIEPETCEEFETEVRIAREAAIADLHKLLKDAAQREADAAELAKLRAEAAEREKEREAERLRKEGEERARLEAEADARAEKARVEAEVARLAAEHRAEVEALERKAVEAAEKAKREAEEAARKAAEDAAARAADKAHRQRVNRAALAALTDAGIAEDVAKTVIKLIASGKVPGAAMTY